MVQIDFKKPEIEMADVMKGAARREVFIPPHGFVALIDVMPRYVPEGRTADCAIVQAARTSYQDGTTHVSKDEALIRYLLRRRHTSPFEMVNLKFHCKMPIFVARQWVRHRTASLNELSGRYSVLPSEFFRPAKVRGQSLENRQGSEGVVGVNTAAAYFNYLSRSEGQHAEYEELTEKGVARELARIGLPLSTYTEWYWEIDLHNFMHFLGLRMDTHAQEEIRDYANAMFELAELVVPITMKAFVDYRLKAMHLTRLEVEAIRSGGQLETENRRELAEWAEKKKRLGIP